MDRLSWLPGAWLIAATFFMTSCDVTGGDGFAYDLEPYEGAQDDDDDLAADDDDTLSDGDWDPTPPMDAPVGSIMVAVVECGMLTGAQSEYWVRTEEGWEWEQFAAYEHDFFDEYDDAGEVLYTGRPYDGLFGCFELETWDRTLFWDEDDGFIEYFQGGWAHDMTPTDIEGLWLGVTYPLHDPSEDCVANMEALGLEIPSTLSLHVYGVLPPGTTELPPTVPSGH
jgi:hypothetical protein